MPTTTYLGLTYPSLSDAPNGPQQMQTLASNIDSKLGGVFICTSGTRPPGRSGALIYETDTNRLMKWNTSSGGFWEVVASSRTSHTPVLTGSGSNPTLGTGNVVSGWYAYGPGSTLTYSFSVQFGTSGVAAGSGQYLVSLPVTAVGALGSAQPAMGSGLIRRNSSGEIRGVTLYIPGSNLNVVAFVADATHGTVQATAPWGVSWAASDYLSGTITYPV